MFLADGMALAIFCVTGLILCAVLLVHVLKYRF